jgi:class 3 adenylate cyclase
VATDRTLQTPGGCPNELGSAAPSKLGAVVGSRLLWSPAVSRLDPRERASLPDRAFAYIDSRGQRRLPIHDAAHVRNALARFGQVSFEDDAACERARTRLLKAAKKYRIVPVGFIATQLETERARGERKDQPIELPSGFVTMLMSDIEGSTGLVHQLGAGYRELIDGVYAVQRASVIEAGGFEVEARADEFFAVFAAPRSGVDAAVAVQHELQRRSWPEGVDVRLRIGVHSGYPTTNGTNYIGLDVHTTSRICSAGHGGQIVVSANTREGVEASDPQGVRFRALGAYRLRGLPEELALFQVAADGLPLRFPPLRTPASG